METNNHTENSGQEKQAGFQRPWSLKEKILCGFWCVVVVLFAFWMRSWIPLVLLPFVVDAYWTRFVRWDWWKSIKNGFLRGLMSWVDAIIFALCAVWVLQNFFFQNFQIPTTSLEKTMLAGDYLLVSKYHYGPRVPMTPLSLPLFQHTIEIGPFNLGKSYIEHPQVNYRRMAGLRDVQRYDIVVFNYPSGDTVATKMQNDDYYRLKFHHGVRRMHTDKGQFGEIVYRPVDRRENYVKRCVGLPGDSLQIINGVVLIDGKALPDPEYLQHNYFVVTTPDAVISEKTWRKLGCHMADVYALDNWQVNAALGFAQDSVSGLWDRIYLVPLTQEMQVALRQMKVVKEILPCPAEFFGRDYVYPLSETNTWTRNDYGPILIPRRGTTIRLDAAAEALYGRCIRNYEPSEQGDGQGNSLIVQADGTYLLNGRPVSEYTFRMDYYWMMGDNRDNSADSRYWGFVPEDHLVGTPLFIWGSKNLETGSWRSERWLKSVPAGNVSL